MEAKTSDNFIAFTPAMVMLLGRIEADKQKLLEGFLAANNQSGGRWTVMPDGSGLLRDDSEPK